MQFWSKTRIGNFEQKRVFLMIEEPSYKKERKLCEFTSKCQREEWNFEKQNGKNVVKKCSLGQKLELEPASFGKKLWTEMVFLTVGERSRQKNPKSRELASNLWREKWNFPKIEWKNGVKKCNFGEKLKLGSSSGKGFY